MENTFKRLLSLVVAVIMVISLVPLNGLQVYAAEVDSDSAQVSGQSDDNPYAQDLEFTATNDDGSKVAYCPVCKADKDWLPITATSNYYDENGSKGAYHYYVADPSEGTKGTVVNKVRYATQRFLYLSRADATSITCLHLNGNNLEFNGYIESNGGDLNFMGTGYLSGNYNPLASGVSPVYQNQPYRGMTISLSSSYSDLRIYSGTVKKQDTTKANAAVASIANKPNIFLYDGAAIENGVRVAGGTFTMNGGTVSGGVHVEPWVYSDGSGSGTNPSSFVMNGGTVEGGNVRVIGSDKSSTATASITMNGGTIQNGVVEGGNGGNLYVVSGASAKATAELVSGTIRNGQAIPTVSEDGTVTGGLGGNVYGLYNAKNASGEYFKVGKDGNAAKMVIADGTAYQGGNIWFDSPGSSRNLALYNNTEITGGKAEAATNGEQTVTNNQGGNVWGGYYTMVKGTVSGGQAPGGVGGNILLESASATFYNGCLVTGGKAANGGNIYGELKLTFNSGAKVTNGEATRNGGNIYYKGTGSNYPMALTGTTVTGGTAVNGGNLYIDSQLDKTSTVTLTNCTMTGGTGSNIAVEAGTLTIDGGTIGAAGDEERVALATGEAAGSSITINDATVYGTFDVDTMAINHGHFSADPTAYAAEGTSVVMQNTGLYGVHTPDGEGTVESAPTCTGAGATNYNCTTCDSYTAVVAATGHTEATKEENRVEATCGKAGSYELVTYCSVCTEELDREEKTIPATGEHTEATKEENRVEATCGKAGSYELVTYCSVCTEELDREEKTIPATGEHTEATREENRVDATETQDGSYELVTYCSVCTEVLKREPQVLPATGTKVAQVGDDTYYSIADAIAAIGESGTITMIADYEITEALATEGKDITIDLGGTILSVSEQITVSAGDTLKVTGDGTLKVNKQINVNGVLDVYDLAYGTPGLYPGLQGNLAIGNGGKVILLSQWSNQTAELLNLYRNTFFYNSQVGAQAQLGQKVYNLTADGWVIAGAVASIDREYQGVAYTETYNSLEAAIADAKAGETIKLIASVETDAAIVVDKTVVLDLNNCNISASDADIYGDGVFHVVSGGDLTIDGDGIIDGVGNNNYNIAIWADGGKVTINGGTYTNVGATDSNGDTRFDLIYVKNGGLVEIYDGIFEAEDEKFTLNCYDDHYDIGKATIKVYGGKFKGFDPAANYAENADGTTNFLGNAEDHTALVDGYYSICEGEIVVDEAVAPDCVNTGLTEGKHCAECQKVLVAQEVVEALGHTEVIDAAVAATCTATGLTEGKHCSVCNEVLVAQTVVEALGHNYSSEVTAEPTCEGKGVKTYTCANCGDSYTEEIAALGHTLTQVEAKPATCTEAGYEAYEYCSVCDYTTFAEIAALGHTLTQVEAKPATCTEAGYEAYEYCSVCDYTTFAEIAALGHDLVYVDAKEPDFGGVIGWYAYEYCKVCDHTTYVERPALTGVASVNGIGYETLAGAVAAAQANDIITLHADVSEDEVVIVKKPLTIKANGYAITEDNVACMKYTNAEGDKVQLTCDETTDGLVIQVVKMTAEEAGDPLAYVDINNNSALDAGEAVDTLQAALNAAAKDQIVRLTGDLTVDSTVIIPSGVTLDIQKNTLTVKTLIGLNESALTGATFVKGGEYGKLVVDTDNLVLAVDAYYDGKYDVIPVYNTDHYAFSRMEVNTDRAKDANRGLWIDEAAKTIDFQFVTNMTGDVRKNLLNDGADDNELKIVIRLEWETDKGIAYQDYVYKKEFVSDVCTNSKEFGFLLTGYDVVGINIATLKVKGMVITESGIEVCGIRWDNTMNTTKGE